MATRYYLFQMKSWKLWVGKMVQSWTSRLSATPSAYLELSSEDIDLINEKLYDAAEHDERTRGLGKLYSLANEDVGEGA